MYVQAGSAGLAREFSETLNQLLLEVIGQVVLSSKENDSSLGYLDNELA